MYEIATIHVSGVKALALDRRDIPAGITGAALKLVYNDPIWDNLVKTVVFQGAKTVQVFNAGSIVKFPPEVAAVKNTNVKVGVYGVDSDGLGVIPTLWADLGVVKPSAAGSFPPPQEQAPPLWVQVMGSIGDLAKLDTENRENLVAAINEVLSKVGSGGSNVDLSGYAKVEQLPDSTSDLVNDSGFITRLVADLANYYAKSETYGREEIDRKISAIPKFSVAVVSALPSENISDTTIYLLTTGSATEDLYSEWIWANERWELLGSQRVDLTGYAKEDWVRQQLAEYQPKGDYLTEAPVTSVNGKAGAVELTAEDVGARSADWMPSASDVGALPNTTVIPSVPKKVSAFENDAGYMTGEQNIATQDSATLGAELASASGWTLGAGWSGSFASGFTHASGNTEPLTFTPSGITAGKLYQVTFKSSVAMTTSNLFVQVGNSTQFNLYGAESGGYLSIGALAADDSGLVFTPESSFAGKLTEISLREITGTYAAVQQYFDTNEAVSFEIHVTPRGLENVFLGPAAGQNNTSGHDNVAVGVNALMQNTSGFWNSALGKDALKNNTGGSRNIAVGYNALRDNEVGQRNIAIGTFTMTQMKKGNWNVAIGADSMNEASDSEKNTAVGFNTLVHNQGNHNVALGADALAQNTAGENNTAVGTRSMTANKSGKENTAVGFGALQKCTSGSWNTAVGDVALYSLTTGQKNVAIGMGAGKSLTTGKRCIAIGAEADLEAAVDDQINIGNLIKGSLKNGASYMNLVGGLRLPNIPAAYPNNSTEVWNNGGVLMIGDGGMDTIVKAVIAALPVYNGEVG